jgi:hypothetical protein
MSVGRCYLNEILQIASAFIFCLLGRPGAISELGSIGDLLINVIEENGSSRITDISVLVSIVDVVS